MASTISAGTTSSTGLVCTADTTGALQLATNNGTVAVTIDASQNVGIGTSSPAYKLDVQGGISSFTNSSAEAVRISKVSAIVNSNESSRNLVLYSTDSYAADLGPQMSFGGATNGGTTPYAFATIAGRKEGATSYAGYLQFSTTAGTSAVITERMRIDSTGEVLIGNSTASQTMDGLFVRGKRTATSNQYNFLVYTQNGDMTFACRDDYYVRSPSIYARTVGSAANVFVDSSGYLYRSTSSIKYKRDVTDYDKGVSTVMQLRPVYYKSKVNDPEGNQIDTQYAGLIAEELDALGLDEFVVKDNEGEVESIQYSNMVALLTKAIQEQQSLITQQAAAIEALTTRIAALEGTPA